MGNGEINMLNIIFQVYFTGEDHSVLNKHLQVYAQFDKKLKKNLNFILIDDGSKIPVKLPKRLGLNIQLYIKTRNSNNLQREKK